MAPETLHSNSYNPNTVFSPELELLKVSLLADGWTQPIVVDDTNEIIDGFHRWTLGSKDPEVRAMSGGLVPVVKLTGKTLADRMAATVRHNRARGQHGILKMAAIVLKMAEEGLSNDEIERALGMEDEERMRLMDLRSSPASAGKDSFGRGWVPTHNSTEAAPMPAVEDDTDDGDGDSA